jgi:hypothetical protein
MNGGTINRPDNSTVLWSSLGTLTNSGTLNLGAGIYSSPIINQGVINISGATFNGLFTNQSTLNASGANLFSGGLSMAAGSQVNGATGTSINLGSAPLSLAGAGTFNLNSVSLSNAGATTVVAGQTLSLTGSALSTSQAFNNGGAVTLSASTLSLGNGGSFNAATFNVGTGSSLSFAGGSNNFSGASSTTGAGTVQLGAGTYAGTGSLSLGTTTTVAASVNFAPALTNSNTMTLANGVTLTAAAGYTQTAGTTALGAVSGESANITAPTGVAINGGSLKGSGTITGNLAVGTATLAPGFSPGTLTVTGNLTLAPSSTTVMELGGSAAGTYDVINVSGNAALNGALNVVYWGGYTGATAATSFPVMRYGSSSGSFATTTLPAASYSMSYGPGSAVLNFASGAVLPPAIPLAAPPSGLTTLSNSLVVLYASADPGLVQFAADPFAAGVSLVSNAAGTSSADTAVGADAAALPAGANAGVEQCR